MSTIVKVRNPKTGIVYAYEQFAKWDPSKGQSRPTRKYLGRFDEETETIIPSTGKRGRPKVKKDEPVMQEDPVQDYLALRNRYDAVIRELESCKEKITSLQVENDHLRNSLTQTIKLVQNASLALEDVAVSLQM